MIMIMIMKYANNKSYSQKTFRLLFVDTVYNST